MKIKHFSGYGSVNAKYVKKTTWTGLYGEMFERRYVVVTGNHERGLYSDYMDNNDIYNCFCINTRCNTLRNKYNSVYCFRDTGYNYQLQY